VVTSPPQPSPPADPAAGSAGSSAVLAYAGTIFTVGAITLLALSAVQLPRIDWGSRQMWASYLLGALLFAGELRRMRVVRKDGDTDRLTVSSTFAVALVIMGPLVLAVLAQVAATALDDLRRRRPPLVIVFNLGQYCLTLTAVHAAFVLPQGRAFGSVEIVDGSVPLWPAVAAAATYFVANNVIVGGVVALDSGQPLGDVLREDLRIQGMDSAIMLGLAPITAVISNRALALVPLIVLPLLGVQRNAWIAAQRQHESLHDALTGLPNRVLFRVRAESALRTAAERGGQVAVMLVDLDHFKEVNDTLGHHIGDGLLREVSHRMRAALPAEVTVARLGGDEFAILVPRADGLDQVTALAHQAMSRLREPLVAEGIRLGVQASIGLAIYPEHAGSIETLLQRADIALYRAKTNRGETQAYRSDLDPHSVRRLSLHGDLHAAVDNRELELAYQPQVDAATGAPVAFEALMRWNHPVHGPVPPDVFIPLAENSGLIAALTRQCVETSLDTLATLRRDNHDVGVAVNLSARLLADLELPGWLAACLTAADVPAHQLTIEVTESSITADPGRAMRVLAELRGLGIRIAIDDFGTGYSSLSYLTKLHPDEIKIDKSFVLQMRHEDHCAVIVRSTIDLAHGLGLNVVAEGVEDQATYDALVTLGCDRIQGYHVARPMSIQTLADWTTTTHTDIGPSWVTPPDPAHGDVLVLRRPHRSTSA
jgi:diguanylate cyclase (GGDEF)-like protein